MVSRRRVEGFMVLFKLALLVGVFLASPFVFREIWSFISPGLYSRERKWGIGFIFASVLLFVGGAAFAYSYVLPASYKYFLGYSTESLGIIKHVLGKTFDIKLSLPFDIKPMITMDEYFGLTSMLLLVFGVVFELPLLLAVLAILGIVSAGQLWRFNRYAIVLFAVLGAVLTPGDFVVGQLAMTASLTVLYNLSILIAFLVGKKRKEREAAEERALPRTSRAARRPRYRTWRRRRLVGRGGSGEAPPHAERGAARRAARSTAMPSAPLVEASSAWRSSVAHARLRLVDGAIALGVGGGAQLGDVALGVARVGLRRRSSRAAGRRRRRWRCAPAGSCAAPPRRCGRAWGARWCRRCPTRARRHRRPARRRARAVAAAPVAAARARAPAPPAGANRRLAESAPRRRARP